MSMMKYLLVLAVVLGGIWLWQRGRRLEDQREARRQARPPQALPMVRCTHCGMHVPGNEVVSGRAGDYCSVAHRRESEGQ